ncbi:MAG: DUF2946 family protein [Phycisphaerales bacterium JB059]
MTRHPRQGMTLVGVVLIALQLLLSGASSWHHHDSAGGHEQCHHQDRQDDGREDQAPSSPDEDCAVCLAINLMGQATFDEPALVEAPERVEVIADRARSLVSRDEVVATARGPPVLG